MIKNKNGFTLIEIMLGVLIFSFVVIGGFYALSSITLGKIKLIENTNINKEAFYFSEKLFEEIKKGGTIDYEEYFNRKVRGTTTSSGHYVDYTGFGNFGSGSSSVGSNNPNFGDSFYFCRSGSGANLNMGSGTLNPEGGCFSGTSFNNYSSSFSGKTQRYGQYAFQFIDYNSNYDGDLGNEDGDGNGNIRGDDDDENLGTGPTAFSSGQNLSEIYLLGDNGYSRTIFRWTVKNDPKKPSTANCDFINATGSGCLGNIEMLKLLGKDWGINHSKTLTGSYDGIIDTWIIDPKYTGGDEVIAGSGSIDSYWQPIFPDSLNVTDFKIYAYPNIYRKYAWKTSISDKSSNINPYIRLSMTLKPSWKKMAGMKGTISETKISTTINLVDYINIK